MKCDLSTVTVILWKSDNPVSITPEFWKLRYLLVSMRSIHLGLLDFYNMLVLLLDAENYKYHRNLSQKYPLSEH